MSGPAAGGDPEYTRRVRPLQSGYSLGARGRVGSLGLVVVRRDGGIALLSSSHVLNHRPDGRAWPIYQPALRDAGTHMRPIARSVCYVALSPDRPNRSEGALAVLDDPAAASPEHPLGRLTGVAERLELGQTLIKVGRTTGVTRGRVIALDWQGLVRFRSGVAMFERQLLIEGEQPVSLHGDSGSVWLTEKLEVAALNFAGLDGGRRSISTPIDRVLRRLDVELFA